MTALTNCRKGETSNNALGTREAVNAVHEVERVDIASDPAGRDEDERNGKEKVESTWIKKDHREHESNTQLHRKSKERGKRPEKVVKKANDSKEHARRHQNSEVRRPRR